MGDSPTGSDGRGGNGEPNRSTGGGKEEPGTSTYRTTFDAETESAAMAVVFALAALSNVEPTEMEPLSTVVNPDALENVFQPDTNGRVVFTHHGHEVVVHADGELAVTKVSG